MLPRHSRARAGKVSRLKALKPSEAPKPRPVLDEEQTRQLTLLMHDRFGFEPKDFQIAAVKAQVEGVDMIVQAATGAGKTAIAAGPHLWPGNEKKFTIMTCPLLSLEEEMVQTFENDYGLSAIALNSKNGGCSPEKISDILALKYQIILISPEMLQSGTFHSRVLRNASFMRNMLSMFIDEAHCIVHWGAGFRKMYGTLGKLRVFFPRGTPVIAVSATLTPRVVRAIHRSLYFTQSDAQWRFLNKGNDRPNVSLVVRACEHALYSYADLDFVIPAILREPNDIPKTYLYVDNIATGGEIIDYINTQIRARIANTEAPAAPRLSRTMQKRFRGIIRPFNATLSASYRTRAMDRFRSGHVRILVCTDAAGMGCNIPDVDRVVQWKLPATFSHWIQRAGRAARGPGRTGIAVLLVERSVYNVDLFNNATQTGTSSKPSKSKTKKAQAQSTTITAEPITKRDAKHVREYALAHGLARGGSSETDQVPTGEQPPVHEEDPDEGLHAFVQSTVCRRKAWAAAFDSGIATPIVPCCDICDPTLLNQTRPPVLPPDKRAKTIKRGEVDLAARQKLYNWRETTYLRDHRTAQYDDAGILADELVDTLVSHGPLSPDQVAGILRDKWVFWGQHGSELSALVVSLEITFKALPPKARRTGKKDSGTPAPQPVHTNQPSDPPFQLLPIPDGSYPHAQPRLEAQSHGVRVHPTPSFGLAPTLLAATSFSSYPPPMPSHHAHSLPTSHLAHTFNSTAQPAPSRASTPMTHSAHFAATTSVHLRPYPSSFPQNQLHLQDGQLAHQHYSLAHWQAAPAARRAADVPVPHRRDTVTSDYHPEYDYSASYMGFESHSHGAPMPSQASEMPPPPPPPPLPPQSQLPGPSESQLFESESYPDHYYPSLLPTQYYTSQTQYDTTYGTNPSPSQSTAQTAYGGPPGPQSMPTSSPHSEYYSDTYHASNSGQYEYMHY